MIEWPTHNINHSWTLCRLIRRGAPPASCGAMFPCFFFAFLIRFNPAAFLHALYFPNLGALRSQEATQLFLCFLNPQPCIRFTARFAFLAEAVVVQTFGGLLICFSALSCCMQEKQGASIAQYCRPCWLICKPLVGFSSWLQLISFPAFFFFLLMFADPGLKKQKSKALWLLISGRRSVTTVNEAGGHPGPVAPLVSAYSKLLLFSTKVRWKLQ